MAGAVSSPLLQALNELGDPAAGGGSGVVVRPDLFLEPSESLRAAFAKHAEGLLRDMQRLVDAEVERLRQELQQTEVELRAKLKEECAALELERTRVDETRAVLEAREIAFERERDKIESQRHMQDVIELNIGGQERCAVRRATLCAIDDSMLAIMFSGRWDDALSKDSEGRVFIDSSPDLFMPLLDYLRRRSVEDPADPAEPPQLPQGRSRAFYQMLGFYGLRDLVCPMGKWELEYGDCCFSEDGLTATAKRQAGRWNCAAVLPRGSCKGCLWSFEVIKTSEEKSWYNDSLAFAVCVGDSPCCSSAGELEEGLATFPKDFAPFDRTRMHVQVVVQGGNLSIRVNQVEVSARFISGTTEQPFRLLVSLTYPWIHVCLKSAEPLLD